MKTGSVRGAELRAALQGDYWRADSAELIVTAWELLAIIKKRRLVVPDHPGHRFRSNPATDPG